MAAAPRTAWVYRAEAAQPAATPPAPQALPAPNGNGSSRPATRPVQGVPDPTTIMLAAIETMAHTVAAANRIFLAAASVMGAPIEVTRKILGL